MTSRQHALELALQTQLLHGHQRMILHDGRQYHLHDQDGWITEVVLTEPRKMNKAVVLEVAVKVCAAAVVRCSAAAAVHRRG